MPETELNREEELDKKEEKHSREEEQDREERIDAVIKKYWLLKKTLSVSCKRLESMMLQAISPKCINNMESLYLNRPNLVIGFHGCDQSVVDMVVTG